MKLNALIAQLGLASLLVVVGAARLQALDIAQSLESVEALDEAGACYGELDGELDEFEGINLTQEQEVAIAQAEKALDAKTEKLFSPEQRRTLDAMDQQLEQILQPILTAEQQTLLAQEGLDVLETVDFTPEQLEQLEQLEETFWTDEDLDITATQEKELEGYEKAFDQAIASILSAPQLAQLQRNQFNLDFPEFEPLQLTPEQQKQILAIDEQYEQSEETFFPELSLQQEEALDALEQQYQSEFLRILTSQQQQLWQADAEEDELGLSTEQQAQIDALDEKFEARIAEIVPELSEENLAQLEQLDEQYDAQLNRILTTEQQQQLEAFWQESCG